MAKIHRLRKERIRSGTIEYYIFNCPGCGYAHMVTVKGEGVVGGRPLWDWNGSLDKPTFSPSILVEPQRPKNRCHSYIKGGMIQFLPDCHHDLKGQTVEIPEWE